MNNPVPYPNRQDGNISSSVRPWEQGLACKREGKWQQAYDIFEKLLSQTAESMSPSAVSEKGRLYPENNLLWDLAICATALGDGDKAASCWRRLGLPVQQEKPGFLPYVAGLEPAAVRLGEDRSGESPEMYVEVLPVSPISPCHGVVQAPSLLGEGVGYGDLLLWDAGPSGAWELSPDRSLPIFHPLAVLCAGSELTLEFVGEYAKQGGRSCVDLPFWQQTTWTTEGVHWFIREDKISESSESLYFFGKLVLETHAGLAAFAEELEQKLTQEQKLLLACPRLYESLQETKQASRHHKLWSALARRRDAC